MSSMEIPAIWDCPKRPAIRQDNKKSISITASGRRPTQIKTTDNYVGINWEKE